MEGHIMEINVKAEDIDALDHVNNLVYINYLEKARLAWYKEIGVNLKELIKQGQAIVLRNLNISYINEARIGDQLTIQTVPLQRGKTSFVLKQHIYNQHQEKITEAETVTVMIDLEKRKSIPLMEEIAMHFEER